MVALTVTRAALPLLVGTMLLTSGGCGSAEPAGAETPTRAEPTAGAARRAAMTVITIEAGERRWTARIDDTPAGREFLAQLPLELTLKDFGGNEKIADLPRALTRDDAPAAITPKAGDVTYYAPWGNLAVFYGDGHHSPGLIPLGRLEGDIAGLAGGKPIAATIRRATPGR